MFDKRRQRYEGWVRSHSGDLYRFAHRLTGEAAVAEDLVQETFVEAWRSMGRLREAEKARAWLFQILRHRYAHWVRDSKRRIQPVGLSDEAGHANPTERLPGEAMAEREVLERALAELEDRFKEPFLMVFLEGLSCREAAAELGVPLGTVLSRIHRARQRLREAVTRWTEGRGNDGGKAGVDEGMRLRLRYGGEA